MSRVGKLPVSISDSVKVNFIDSLLTIEGKLGKNSFKVPSNLLYNNDNKEITFTPKDESIRARANWGMARSIVNAMVKGVTDGYHIKLELQGVGYRASVSGNKLTIALGYSHDVVYEIPSDVAIKCESQTILSITGIDKQKVGKVASIIKRFRKYNPYKGKGIYIIYPKPDYRIKKEGKKK